MQTIESERRRVHKEETCAKLSRKTARERSNYALIFRAPGERRKLKRTHTHFSEAGEKKGAVRWPRESLLTAFLSFSSYSLSASRLPNADAVIRFRSCFSLSSLASRAGHCLTFAGEKRQDSGEHASGGSHAALNDGHLASHSPVIAPISKSRENSSIKSAGVLSSSRTLRFSRDAHRERDPCTFLERSRSVDSDHEPRGRRFRRDSPSLQSSDC